MGEKIEKGIGIIEITIPEKIPRSFPPGTTADITDGGVTLIIPEREPEE